MLPFFHEYLCHAAGQFARYADFGCLCLSLHGVGLRLDEEESDDGYSEDHDQYDYNGEDKGAVFLCDCFFVQALLYGGIIYVAHS